MTASETIQPQILSRLADICAALAKGDYVRAKELFALTANTKNPPVIAELAEAFGLMLVKIEAREYHLEKLVAELDAGCKEQEKLKDALARENRQLRDNLRKAAGPGQIIGKSELIQEVLRQAARIARVDATVLITGETGTGKGMLAKYLHYEGARSKGPFVSVNCAAIPDTLLESELFGIEKGVASGVSARMGRFEQANGGTIFLDEIGDMPLESQAKILHVIENHSLERVGGRKSIPVDVRIIAATHRDLGAMCDEKLFRSDLYYRLNVIRLHMPALRERPEDIPPLVSYFLDLCSRRNPGAASGITQEALRLMETHDWPGNIRELENETERAALLARSSAVTPQDLSPTLASLRPPLPHGAPPTLPHPFEKTSKPATGLSLRPRGPVTSLNEMEADMVRRALAEAGGNKSQAARTLGISREGLRKMLKRLNIPG